MKILAIGPLWRGSNAGGLFRAFSRQGHVLDVVDEFYFISLQTKNKRTKIAERMIRPWQTKEFNNAIKNKITTLSPDIILVYKGVFVLPETLEFAKKNNCLPVLFYPDVSMTAHGPNIPRSIPLYDLILTTKTFGIRDINSKFGVKNTYFIPHGFDPEIHRPLPITDEDRKYFGCDVSFIGTWSPKKEQYMGVLMDRYPGINLKIWGDRWQQTTTNSIKTAIQGKSIVGDLYAMAIQCSAINLGILSEKVSGASSGDLITSRTFHIPGAGGFMLHERNEESVLYFREDEEAAFFNDPEEMAIKVQHYLDNETEREKIRQAGHKRAVAEHSLDARATVIMEQIKLL
jgi:spore maturation protein CgeB